ncbi:MAG: SsrA-binding protein SmpB [Actinomycetota bacterium]
MAKQDPDKLVVASNRRAKRDYDILDTFEAGLVLKGSEVKSLREGKAQIAEGYAQIRNGEAWLHGVHIPPWLTSSMWAVDPDRSRKLLLHRREIERLDARLAQERLTLVPLRLYFTDGRAKIELALGRGRKQHDKRHAIAKRDADLEARRAMAQGMRRRRQG